VSCARLPLTVSETAFRIPAAVTGVTRSPAMLCSKRRRLVRRPQAAGAVQGTREARQKHDRSLPQKTRNAAVQGVREACQKLDRSLPKKELHLHALTSKIVQRISTSKGKVRCVSASKSMTTFFPLLLLFFPFLERMSPARWGHPDGCPPAWPARNVKTEVENKVCMIRAGFCALRSGITLELLIISAPDLRTRENRSTCSVQDSLNRDQKSGNKNQGSA